jgi:hypothetical protein
MKKIFSFFFFAALCLSVWSGQLNAQQYCGDIENQGDTLLRIRKESILPGQTYQWYKNGAPIPGANAPFLRINRAEAQGVFTLRAVAPTEKIQVNELQPKVLIGKTLNHRLKPAAGVEVRLGEIMAQSDARGEFVLTLPEGSAPRLVLYFDKPGYFRAAKVLTPAEGDTLYLTQLLIPLGEPFELDTRFEGTLFNPFTLVTLPPNSLQDENAAVYTGPYKGYLCSFAPSDPRIASLMPGGDFMGLSAQNDMVYLQTYGFLGVELRDTAGRPLQLRPGYRARVAQAIEEGMCANAPSQMPLWHFDETRGYWVQEGAPATKSADNQWYEGRVSHFSFWNWDVPFPLSFVKGKAIDCQNLPIKGMYIDVYFPTIRQRRMTFTDNEGQFEVAVLANTPINIIYQLKDTVALAPLPENQTFELPAFVGDINAAFGINGIAYCNKDSAVINFYAPEGAYVAYMNPTQTVTQSSPVFVGDYQDAPYFWAILQNPANVCKPVDTLKVLTYSGFAFEGICNNFPYSSTASYSFEHSMRRLPHSINWVHVAEDSLQLYPLLNYFPCIKALVAHGIQISNSTLPLISKHTYLQLLDIGNNRISSLPEAFWNLTKLKELYVGYNQFTSLAERIGNLTQLQTLDLGNNQLSALPESLGNLTQLQTLNLGNNQLSSLPETIGNLTQLQMLNLYNNRLTSLPETIANLAGSLRFLYLGGNSIPEQHKAQIRQWLPNTRIDF